MSIPPRASLRISLIAAQFEGGRLTRAVVGHGVVVAVAQVHDSRAYARAELRGPEGTGRGQNTTDSSPRSVLVANFQRRKRNIKPAIFLFVVGACTRLGRNTGGDLSIGRCWKTLLQPQ